eukprot:scaffold1894_cov368-Prasinococcus_capsulatus_cf.AAC.5
MGKAKQSSITSFFGGGKLKAVEKKPGAIEKFFKPVESERTVAGGTDNLPAVKEEATRVKPSENAKDSPSPTELSGFRVEVETGNGRKRQRLTKVDGTKREASPSKQQELFVEVERDPTKRAARRIVVDDDEDDQVDDEGLTEQRQNDCTAVEHKARVDTEASDQRGDAQDTDPSEAQAKTCDGLGQPKSANNEGLEEDAEEEHSDEDLDDDDEKLKPRKGQGAKKASAKKSKEAVSFAHLREPTWPAGEPVPYAALVRCFEEIETHSGRLQKLDALVNFFRCVIATTETELVSCVYLCINKLGPSHLAPVLGIGDSILLKVIAETTGKMETHVKREYEEIGDIGLLAQGSRSKQRTLFQPKPLTVPHVLKTFLTIASTEGNKSVERKRGLINKLLVASKGSEPKFLMRSLQGKSLRLGLQEKTVIPALAQAFLLERGGKISSNMMAEKCEEAEKLLKRVFCVHPVYDTLIGGLLNPDIGLAGIEEHCKMKVGVPLQCMLARPTNGVQDIIERFEGLEFTCEYKYDGERAQVHLLEDGSVEIYSRNSERSTEKYPDVAEIVKQAAKNVTSCVIDCEAVAYDVAAKKILPFQTLSTRSKKAADSTDVKVAVCVFAFDCILLNDEPLLSKSLKERRDALRGSFAEIESKFMFAKSMESRDTEEILTFLNEAVKDSTEGLMIKTLVDEATYEPSKRSNKWLKLKKDYMDSLGDSLDLVVIGAYYGKGKRTGTYGGYLMACYDEDEEQYQSVCKLGTGFSDTALQELHASLADLICDGPKSYYRYGDALKADVWFEPKQVWEVKAADLSISPQHYAAVGKVHPEKGIALRFPRYLRTRDDKQPEQATSSDQVMDMYNSQQVVTGSKKRDVDSDDD